MNALFERIQEALPNTLTDVDQYYGRPAIRVSTHGHHWYIFENGSFRAEEASQTTSERPGDLITLLALLAQPDN